MRPRRFHSQWRGFACALLLASAPAVGLAQALDCNRLQAAINATADDDARGDIEYSRAAERQRVEIERTRSYAQSVGCDARGFDGLDAPEQCDGIASRLARMQDNLDQIEARQRDMSTTSSRRADMMARYDRLCTRIPGNPADPPQGRDDAAFDNGTRGMPPDDPGFGILDDGGSDTPRGRHTGKTICVRSCDGGFFPLSPRSDDDQLESLDQLCRASCPNTEAHLYTMPSGDDLAAATAIDGTPYTSLPAAFKFQKSFDASCTCKPPGKTWVQALAEAEKLLPQDDDHGDVTVTAQMSADMAKPTASAPTPQPKAKAGKRDKKQARLPQPPAIGPETVIALDGARAAQAPTASGASADIVPTPAPGRPTLRQGDGPTAVVQGPDGLKRTIRVIVP